MSKYLNNFKYDEVEKTVVNLLYLRSLLYIKLLLEKFFNVIVQILTQVS